jgi:hypothetical protein
MGGIRYTEDEYAALISTRAARDHNPSVQTPNVERHADVRLPAKAQGQEVHSRFRIHYRQRRRRLIDADGLYSKAATDGLTIGGLFDDDRPEWVESVTQSQEKAHVEETIIEVWEIWP